MAMTTPATSRLPLILTDIEGTTSSISFVKDVLFPYARRELPRRILPALAGRALARLRDRGTQPVENSTSNVVPAGGYAVDVTSLRGESRTLHRIHHDGPGCVEQAEAGPLGIGVLGCPRDACDPRPQPRNDLCDDPRLLAEVDGRAAGTLAIRPFAQHFGRRAMVVARRLLQHPRPVEGDAQVPVLLRAHRPGHLGLRLLPPERLHEARLGEPEQRLPHVELDQPGILDQVAHAALSIQQRQDRALLVACRGSPYIADTPLR